MREKNVSVAGKRLKAIQMLLLLVWMIFEGICWIANYGNSDTWMLLRVCGLIGCFFIVSGMNRLVSSKMNNIICICGSIFVLLLCIASIQETDLYAMISYVTLLLSSVFLYKGLKKPANKVHWICMVIVVISFMTCMVMVALSGPQKRELFGIVRVHSLTFALGVMFVWLSMVETECENRRSGLLWDLPSELRVGGMDFVVIMGVICLSCIFVGCFIPLAGSGSESIIKLAGDSKVLITLVVYFVSYLVTWRMLFSTADYVYNRGMMSSYWLLGHSVVGLILCAMVHAMLKKVLLIYSGMGKGIVLLMTAHLILAGVSVLAICIKKSYNIKGEKSETVV